MGEPFKEDFFQTVVNVQWGGGVVVLKDSYNPDSEFDDGRLSSFMTKIHEGDELLNDSKEIKRFTLLTSTGQITYSVLRKDTPQGFVFKFPELRSVRVGRISGHDVSYVLFYKILNDIPDVFIMETLFTFSKVDAALYKGGSLDSRSDPPITGGSNGAAPVPVAHSLFHDTGNVQVTVTKKTLTTA